MKTQLADADGTFAITQSANWSHTVYYCSIYIWMRGAFHSFSAFHREISTQYKWTSALNMLYAEKTSIYTPQKQHDQLKRDNIGSAHIVYIKTLPRQEGDI